MRVILSIGDNLLTFECDCGCDSFHVNRKENMVKCQNCGSKHLFSDGWEKFQEKNKFIHVFIDAPKQIVESARESLVDWRKRNNIERIKKKKDLLTKEETEVIHNAERSKEIEKAIIRKRWKNYIMILNRDGVISFDKNEHFHSLRGKHIAKAMHRDLGKLGIDNRLSFRGSKGSVRLLR